MCQSKTSPSFIARNRFPNVCNGVAENQMSEGIVLKGHTNGNAKRCHQQSIPFHSGTHSLLSHKYRSATTITITRRQPSAQYCLDSVITTFRISYFDYEFYSPITLTLHIQHSWIRGFGIAHTFYFGKFQEGRIYYEMCRFRSLRRLRHCGGRRGCVAQNVWPCRWC